MRVLKFEGENLSVTVRVRIHMAEKKLKIKSIQSYRKG